MDIYSENLAIAGVVIKRINFYKGAGLTKEDAETLSVLGQMSFSTILTKPEVERVRRIVKGYPKNKRRGIEEATKDNFSNRVKIF